MFFSESVSATGSYADVLRVTSQQLAVSCRVAASPYAASPNWMIEAVCSSLSRTHEATVSVLAGTLVGVTGLPAHDPAGNPTTTLTFVPDALKWAGSCGETYL